MDKRTLIQHNLATSQQILKHSLGDITEAEASTLPEIMLSPVVWQVGHLAVVDKYFAERAGGGAAKLPEQYATLFKSGSGGAAEYPSLSETMTAFDTMHETLVRVVAEADLDAPNESPGGPWHNVGEMFSFADVHRWYHIGKINTLRALLGKPRLFG